MNAVEAFCLQVARTTDGILWVAGPEVDDLTGKDVDVEEVASTTNIPDLYKGRRHVLWSVTTLVDEQGWDAVWKRLKELRAQARSTGAQLVVVAEFETLEAGQLARLKAWADGVMELSFDRQGFGLYPVLRLTKMRGAPNVPGLILFKETEKGLFFESTQRVV